ncbi:Uncharacterised protein [Serratia quinivorans]|nr:Uncharacterised protein [Serratia quinivorans]CAI2160663.1 Uncharacterised protein [Serratia quinivorans]
MAVASGFYIAGIYREKASGARADRAELLRMIAELQPGDVGIAEILFASTRDKGARLAIPGLVDLSELVVENNGVPCLVFESVQELLLKVALQTAHDDEIRRERPRQGLNSPKSQASTQAERPIS